MRKTVYTLCVDNYEPEITKRTHPFIKRYADKIGAEFCVIKERKFPRFPVTYEKFQIYELSSRSKCDWNIYIDSDAMIHPDMFDVTELLPLNTVMTCGRDFAPIRFKYDKYFQRDGRHIGAGNWFTVASYLCLDLWHPLNDITLHEAVSNIYPVGKEEARSIGSSHLIDDYVVSRNIAKYGLKFMTFRELLDTHNNPGEFLYHEYLDSTEQKIEHLESVLKMWNDNL